MKALFRLSAVSLNASRVYFMHLFGFGKVIIRVCLDVEKTLMYILLVKLKVMYTYVE